MADTSPQPGNARCSTEVVICTYNGARYLLEQLQSIANQSLPVDRISLYDDGSKDATLAIAEEFAARCERDGIRMVVHRNPANLGYAQNFAQGLQQAQEDLVLFCDQDDLWEPDKVAKLALAFDAGDIAMVFSDGGLIDAQGRPMGQATVLESYGMGPRLMASFSSQAWPALLQRNYVNGAAMMVRREAAQQCLPVPPDFPHDYWIVLSLAANHRIRCIADVLYRYRQHENNTIGIGAMDFPRLLLSIWRNPLPPRALDFRRTRTFLAQGALNEEKRLELTEKLNWLQRAVGKNSRWGRLANLCEAVVRGTMSGLRPRTPSFATSSSWWKGL